MEEYCKTQSFIRERDMHFLVKECQVHSHRNTCFKYCRTGQPKICRFGLSTDNTIPEMTFDLESGNLILQKLDGLVNNYNSTVLEAMRCNMDIKFIGSGTAAKACLYYVIDYITKSQLSAHIGYAAVESALKVVQDQMNGAYKRGGIKEQGKMLLRKCAFSMLARQEVAAPMVMTYLLDLKDHFTNFQYRQWYWQAFEKAIDNQFPSPDCYMSPINIGKRPEDNILRSDIDLLHIQNASQDRTTVDLLNQEENIRILLDNEGNARPNSMQTEDYLLCPEELRSLSVWDFISQTEKEIKKKKKNQDKDPARLFNKDADESDDENMEMEGNEIGTDIDIEEYSLSGVDKHILAGEARKVLDSSA
ncbi:hypothetical protein DL96DRAFT_1567013 [Flagelloscypha sp. PMI_526]|nr:hypothetical protein DL96DRAFT_1567013 [Flagelloscypha sp. PMI_526]